MSTDRPLVVKYRDHWTALVPHPDEPNCATVPFLLAQYGEHRLYMFSCGCNDCMCIREEDMFATQEEAEEGLATWMLLNSAGVSP